jgi:membrane associated rhomboid family serine protease
MLPIKDDNAIRRFPYATYGLILCNIACWSFVQGFGFQPALYESIARYGVVPFCLLRVFGASWHTVLTSMFMHADLLHLAMNMWILAIFGDNLEERMGSVRFVLFYLACGVWATELHVLMNSGRMIPAVGASGAISGMLGGYLMLYPRAPVEVLLPMGVYATRLVVPAHQMIVYWFALQISSVLPGMQGGPNRVAYWAHIGGFLCGAATVKLFMWGNASPGAVTSARQEG